MIYISLTVESPLPDKRKPCGKSELCTKVRHDTNLKQISGKKNLIKLHIDGNKLCIS